MRDRRKIISLDIDSALALMQEIYNDIVEQKTTATLITKKMLAFMQGPDDMSIIGPVIKEQQKILNECTEKKISLVKLQNALLKQMGGHGGGKADFEKLQLTEEDRLLLNKMIEEKDDKNLPSDDNDDESKYKA